MQKKAESIKSHLLGEAGLSPGKTAEVCDALSNLDHRTAQISIDWKSLPNVEKVLDGMGYTTNHLSSYDGESAILFVSTCQPKSISDDLAPLDFINAVEATKKPIDYKGLTDAPVFYVGEKHETDLQRDEAIEILEKSGAQAIALECLPSSAQAHVTDYLNGKNDGKKIRAYLEERMGTSWKSYMDLIDYCKENNVDVVTLEAPSRGSLDDTSLLQKALGSDFDSRNEHWARILKEHTEEHPDAKLMVFCGASHLFSMQQIFPSEVPPLDISTISAPGQKPKREFIDAARIDPLIWKYGGRIYHLHTYQKSSGANDFVANLSGRNYVIKGPIKW